MAVKRCPSCQQCLPVACKSCTCGHIFITKKCHISKDSEDEKNEQLPLKRLRPEKPKRENPDYDYDDYARAALNGGDVQLMTFPKRIFAENYDDDNFDLVGQKFERSDSFEDGMRPTKKKRGRPKGSKNKPKNALLLGICGENYHNPDEPSQLFSNSPRKPGRPKGSKNKVNSDLDGETVPIKVRAKPNKLPPVPQEKLMSYSLILSDINEKLMSQNKIKRLLGI